MGANRAQSAAIKAQKQADSEQICVLNNGEILLRYNY